MSFSLKILHKITLIIKMLLQKACLFMSRDVAFEEKKRESLHVVARCIFDKEGVEHVIYAYKSNLKTS